MSRCTPVDMNIVLECLDVPPVDAQLLEDREIVSDWMNDLLDTQMESTKLSACLQDGVYLCQLTVALFSSARLAGVTDSPPVGVGRFHKRCVAESIQARDNIASFCAWCMLYEVPPVLILSPEDVSLNRNTPALVSLLLYLLRKTSHFTPQTLSRKSSLSSTCSYSDRVNKRRLSRGKSVDMFEVLNQRSVLRPRSLSVDSEGSICSVGSLRSPSGDTSEALIRDLNLACRNINKKVSKVEISMAYEDSFIMDQSQIGESQASIRRKSRASLKSKAVGASASYCNGVSEDNSQRKVSINSNPLTSGDISKEKLTLDDVEYLLLSNTQNICSRIAAIHKLLAVRLLEKRSDLRLGTRAGVMDTMVVKRKDVTEKETRVYPALSLVAHPAPGLHSLIRALKSFIITRVSDSKDITCGCILNIWNDR